MKPFDLEKALSGEPVVTKDGRNVEFLRITGKVIDKNGTSLFTQEWDKEGKSNRNISHGLDNLDLFMVPKKVKRWIWISTDQSPENSGQYYTSPCYQYEYQAVAYCCDNKKGQIIEIEVDE